MKNLIFIIMLVIVDLCVHAQIVETRKNGNSESATIKMDFQAENYSGDKVENVGFSGKGLFINGGVDKGEFISKKIAVPINDVDPYLGFFMGVQIKNFSEENCKIFIRSSQNETLWTNWEQLKKDEHVNETEDNQSQSQNAGFKLNLLFLDKNTKYLQFRIELNEVDVEVQIIHLHFFSLGNPSNTETGEDNDSIEQVFLPSSSMSCPCPQLTYVNRASWSNGLVQENMPVSTPTSVTHFIVHHQAGIANPPYASVVYGIWVYHTTPAPNGSGFNDIGYNWLIAPDGTLYKGRAWNGSNSNVVGAHTCGCNSNKMGVCLLGDFTINSPSTAAYNKLVQLLGWSSCSNSVNPTASTATSNKIIPSCNSCASSCYTNASCTTSSMFNISGHRDACRTSGGNCTVCPGNAFYPQMASLRTDVQNYINNCGAGCPQPTNDGCSSAFAAIPLTFGSSCTPISSTSCGATSSGFSSCSGTMDDDVFFSFVPTSTSATITVVSSAGYDAVFQVLTGPCGSSMSQLACVNATGTGGTETTTISGLTIGVTYFIRVWHHGIGYGATGNFTICVHGCSTPSQPGNILGSTTVCQGSTNTYSIDAVSGATSYTWTLPSGWIGSSTTSSITTTAGSSGGTISVRANNSCGISTSRTLSIAVSQVPTQPLTISGNTTICQGSTNTYAINAVAGAISYTWTLPSGWTGSSSTASITTTAGSSSGTISVTANNSCGTSTSSSLSVTVSPVPAQPLTISGNTTVCQGSINTYSINAVSGATSYTWTLPSGWTGSSTSASITTTAGSSDGIISVTANNSCGTSTSSTLLVTVSQVPTQPLMISGNNTVCQGSTNTYSINAVSGATSYTWTLPSGWTGSSTLASITTTAGSSGGTISVAANGSCGSSMPQVLSVNSFVVDTSVTVNNFTITSNASPAIYQWINCASMTIISGETNQSFSPLQSGSYAVVVTQNGCVDTSFCCQVTITGLESTDKSTGFVVYPNPTNSLLNVKGVGLSEGKYTLTLTNSLGQLVNEQEYNVKSGVMELQINTYGISSGLYFLTIKSKSMSNVFKIEKNN